MATTFQQYKDLTSSKKNILAWIEGNQRVFNFTLDSGTIYSKVMDYFVVAVENNGTALTDGGDSTPADGEFHFDPTTKTLYINIGGTITGNFIAVTYRFFFSDNGENRSWDLDSGDIVHYEPLIKSSSKFTTELDGDVDQLGTAKVGSGSIKLINSEGFFTSIYDKIHFENGLVKIFSLGESIPNSEIQTIYRGRIDSKTFSDNDVTFKIKDALTVLNELIPLELYSESDGDLSENDIGTAKRRIYGECAGVKCVGTNKILQGFTLTGTFSGTIASTTITGTGSSLLSELTPGDTIKYQGLEEELELTVKTVDSDTVFTTEDEIEEEIVNISLINSPERSTNIKNRTWKICGHILKEPATTVDTGIDANRFTVVSTTDLFAGDFVKVGSERKQIRRISGSTIVLETSLSGTPSGGTTVVKSPVQLVYIGPRALRFETDWTLTNTSEAFITLDDRAEENTTPSKTGQGTISITNGTRTVIGVGTDFIRDIRPRDYIKFTGVSGFFEVLQIDSETQLKLAATWTEVTQVTKTYQFKNVEFADDNSIVTVQCLGITEDGTKTGTWVKTASQVAKHLLIEAGESAEINTAKFAIALEDAPQVISVKVPLSPSGQAEDIKTVVNTCNQAVFGSLILTNDYKFKYSVLTSKKPPATTEIKDDDIIDWSVKTDSRQILNKVIVNYQFKDADPITGDESSGVVEKESTFVNRLIKTNRSDTFDVHLFRESEATIIAERIRFFRELSSSIIMLSSKLNFMDRELNDPIYFELDRIFERFGSSDKVKIGVINRIVKDGYNTQIEINDLSGLYNRICNICDNAALEFSDGAVTQKIRAFNGYIVDDDDNLADSSNPETFGINLIG